jgi:hypothetical protein
MASEATLLATRQVKGVTMDNLNLIMLLKRFCSETVAKEILPTPVEIKLLDIGMNEIYEMVADTDSQGTCVFPSERSLSSSLATPGPYRVRFTPKGRKSFIRDLPEQGAAAG